MKKIFMYLYPIKEYTSIFLYHDRLYEDENIKRPLPILNECIQKRYRDKGYQIVYVLYKDKEIFGIDYKEGDKIIYTDIEFTENSGLDENGKEKINFVPKYPNEKSIIKALGNVDELVIGGYHYSDCVKRIGEISLSYGIDTIIDLDLTELFFSLYRKEEYFIIEEYSRKRFKEYIIRELTQIGITFAEKQFNNIYGSPVYRLNK